MEGAKSARMCAKGLRAALADRESCLLSTPYPGLTALALEEALNAKRQVNTS